MLSFLKYMGKSLPNRTAMKKYRKNILLDLSEREIIQAAIELGAKKAKIVSPKRVVTAHWVRWKCRFGCSGAVSWAVHFKRETGDQSLGRADVFRSQPFLCYAVLAH